MSSAPATSPVDGVEDYIRVWAEALAEVVGQGRTFEVLSLAPAEAKLASDGDIWIAATASDEPAGQIVFRVDSVTAAGLVQSSVGHDKESGNLPAADNQTVLLELFRKSVALFGTRAKVPKIELQVEFSSAPSQPSAATYWLRADRPTPSTLEVQLNSALLAYFQQPRPDSVNASVVADTGVDKLGILMDVELVATLRFGKRSMLLKDILDLCAGSVVELDQQVQEPVELLLDGKLIARGDVVIVDGNYGLRVTQLAQSSSN